MKKVLTIFFAVLLFGCAPRENYEEAESHDDMAMLTPADVAGEWSFDVYLAGADSVALTVGMMLAEEGSSMSFPHLEEPVPIAMKMKGDTLITMSDEYPSAFREGVMVTVKSVLKMADGNLEGDFHAKYDTEEADSMMTGTLKGMRK